MRSVRKHMAQRYYQLLTGHAAIRSFLHDRMTGPQRLESDNSWWCNCGRRQSRHHLFAECRAWAPQTRALWSRVGKDWQWEHLRAPALRWLWKEEATEAVLDFLESTRVGCRASASAEAAGARLLWFIYACSLKGYGAAIYTFELQSLIASSSPQFLLLRCCEVPLFCRLVSVLLSPSRVLKKELFRNLENAVLCRNLK